MNLSEAFAKVEVTESQAIALLSDLAGAHSDRDPELFASLNKAITSLSGGKKDEPEKEKEEEPHTSSSLTAPRTATKN